MKVKFSGKTHLEFYHKAVERDKCGDDPYRRALFYTLGMNEETRRHIEELYDFGERLIRPEGLYAGWQTGTSGRVTHLAFNLYNGYCDDNEEDGGAPHLYTPYNIFCDGLLPYMLEAVKVRYSEYAGEE